MQTPENGSFRYAIAAAAAAMVAFVLALVLGPAAARPAFARQAPAAAPVPPAATPANPPTDPQTAAQAATPKITGRFSGALNTGAIQLTVVFNIRAAPDGTLTVTLDSPDQGAMGIPAAKTTFTGGDTLRLEIPAIAGSWEGKLSGDGNTLSGTWTQGGAGLPLTLKRQEKAPEVRRPQTPKPPFPYRAENVEYVNRAAGIRLGATLTIPAVGRGPFPAALLITGSGAQDRDETLFNHKPFAVIADHLTRRGIAVLRVDDRGVNKSTGNFAAATSRDFATDVRAGIAYLQSRREIDKAKIGLIGHSEGGLIAPMVAAGAPKEIAFLVLLAGPGVPGDQILLEQGALIARATGAPESAIASARTGQKAAYAVLKTEPDSAKAEAKLIALNKQTLAEMPEAARKSVGDPDAYAKSATRTLLSPWFRYFLSYDPVPTLKKVRCPVLALNGGRDLQVPPKQNLPALARALRVGGNKNVTTRELPGLNHLFQPSRTGSPAEYGKIETTFAPAALNLMGDWIEQVTINRRPDRVPRRRS